MEEEVVVYTEREVLHEEGGLKARQPATEIKTDESEEAIIFKEFEEIAKEKRALQETNKKVVEVISPQKSDKENPLIEDSKPRNLETEPKAEESLVRQLAQERESLDDFLRNFKKIGHVGEGAIASVDVYEQNTGAQFAFKGLNESRIEELMKTNSEARSVAIALLREEARLTIKLGATGSKHYLPFAIDLTKSEKPGILVPYVAGSLEEKVGSLSPSDALSYFRQAVESIKLLHEHDNISCFGDSKPSNFRIDEKGNLVVVDLDLKYVAPTNANTSMINSIAFSLLGNPQKIKGTPRYMAPEQWEGKADERTDVYQLGAFGYELITGTKPEGAFEDVGEVVPELANLNKVIKQAMAPNPEKRFQTLEEFLGEIDKAMTQEQTAVIEETEDESARDVSNEVPESLKGEIKRTFCYEGVEIPYEEKTRDYGVFRKKMIKYHEPTADILKIREATTPARIKITTEILDKLGNILKTKVNLAGIKRENLQELLKFSEMPIKREGIEFVLTNGNGRAIGEIKYNLGYIVCDYGFDDISLRARTVRVPSIDIKIDKSQLSLQNINRINIELGGDEGEREYTTYKAKLISKGKV